MTVSPKPRKMNRNEVAIARVAQVIEAGRVLVAYNALANEDATVGTYREAVDRGIRFACLSVKGRTTDQHTKTALDAAEVFVLHVGSSRANAAAKATAKQHGLTLRV